MKISKLDDNKINFVEIDLKIDDEKLIDFITKNFMKSLKYFLQFIVILLLFLFSKLLVKYSTKLSGNLFKFIGPLFRSNKICSQNLNLAYPNLDKNKKEKF